MTLEPYQAEAATFLSTKLRAAVDSAAGSGKTVIAAAALKRVLGMKRRDRVVRVGWIGNTKEHLAQAYKALCMVFFDQSPTTGEAELTWQCLIGTRREASEFEIKVACAAAFTNWSDRDLLIIDEAHHVVAPQWRQQVETCAGAVWGFTATPPEDMDGAKAFAEIFPQVFVIDRSRVANRLALARVVMIDKTDQGIRGEMDSMINMELARRQRFSCIDPGALWGQVAWGVCVDRGIVANRLRNDAVIALTKRHASNMTLVLVNKIEHGQTLAARVPGSLMCFSGMGVKARRAALEDFRLERTRCLFATSLADEGLDLPNADVLILVSAGKSRRLAEQRTGRVLRAFAGKTHGTIYDFDDTQHPLMAKHARKRIQLYEELGYKIEYETR